MIHFYCRYAYSEDKGEDSEDEEAHSSIVLVSTERNGSTINVVEEDKRE